MNESELKKVDRNKLPWVYRLILKIPGTDFLETTGGIFWGIIVPIFGALEFMLSLILLVFFPFPINIILTGIIPTILFIVFIRISLERFLKWWDSAFGKSGFEWNVEERLQEYLTMLKKKKDKNE